MRKENGRSALNRGIATLLLLVMLAAMALPASAAGSPPDTIGVPRNFAVTNYGGMSLLCTMAVPDDLRALMKMTDTERGYSMKVIGQADFKTDNGAWHYTAAWDAKDTYYKYGLDISNTITGGDTARFLGGSYLSFKNMFPDAVDVPVQSAYNSWDWFKTHKITARARLGILVYGTGDVIFSDWSSEYVLTDSVTMDYKSIMANNAPTLLSSRIEPRGVTNVPWVIIDMAQHPDAVQMFNAASSNGMWTEIWLKKLGDADFQKVGSFPFAQEKLYLDVSAYFKDKLASYDAAAYEIKVRYVIDERHYQQAEQTTMTNLYSAFSNVLSYNMPAWSAASPWATEELQKADEMGLIPDRLQGADMTHKITREEFAEVALLMYQTASGVTDTAPYSPNPFLDMSNSNILKAFRLGIVKGYSATEFKPDLLINRQEVAAILARTMKLIAPNADYSTDGAPTFTDAADISGWALNDCLYMAKIGIIKGTNNQFMPRAVSEAQKAIGYANTSREQAIAMSVRVTEFMGK